MNNSIISLIILPVLFFIVSYTSSARAYFIQDTTKVDSADYVHADVLKG